MTSFDAVNPILDPAVNPIFVPSTDAVFERVFPARFTKDTAGYCDQLEPEIKGCPFTVPVETDSEDNPVKVPTPPVKDPPLTAPEIVAFDSTVFTEERLLVLRLVVVKEGEVAEVKTARVSV